MPFFTPTRAPEVPIIFFYFVALCIVFISGYINYGYTGIPNFYFCLFCHMTHTVVYIFSTMAKGVVERNATFLLFQITGMKRILNFPLFNLPAMHIIFVGARPIQRINVGIGVIDKNI